MRKKSKEKPSLFALKLQISELINKAMSAGLHNIPYEVYNSVQNKLKNEIIKDFDDIENKLIECILWQEDVYLFLDGLSEKFTNHNIISEKDVAELFLNTDPSLFNKSEALNEKITCAIQLLSQKVSETKKILLDIYYMHRTIELEGCIIGWQAPKNIADQIMQIIDKYFSLNLSYATSKEYYLLKKISNETNFDNAFNLYYNNLDLLLDVTFIKVNDGKSGTFTPIDLYQPFKSVDTIEENLYSPFFGGKVNFVSGTITQRVHNMSMTQRNVSLDVNTVTYIRTMANGRSDNSLSEHIKLLIKNIDIIKKASTFDYLPYILENYVFSPSSEEIVLKTVNSVEHFLYPDDERYCLQNYENVKSLFKAKATIEKVKKEYFIGYALLLLICFINFKFKKMKTLQKLENFCLYMDKMLFLFREPFVEIAFNFFEYGNNYRFFKKIQINAKDIIKELKNMAWDVFHLWCLEAACSTGDVSADLFVPYFYCFDKGLLELKECFDLETIFVNTRTRERICFYHKHSYPIDIIEKYVTIEKEKARRQNFSYENIMSQIDYLETEINSLW